MQIKFKLKLICADKFRSNELEIIPKLEVVTIIVIHVYVKYVPREI